MCDQENSSKMTVLINKSTSYKSKITFTFLSSILFLTFFMALAIILICANSAVYSEYIREQDKISSYRLVCYYNIPESDESLQISDIDPFLCSHINVAFFNIVNNSLQVNSEQLQVIEKLNALKLANKNLKILLSVGGAGNEDFPEMVANHANRKTFIKSVLDLVKSYHIDGVDLDWEFPRNIGREKIHFNQLLIEFRRTINKQQKHKFLLSVAVAASVTIIDEAYDINHINENVDFINLMSYDFHFYDKLTPFTGFNSPLYPSENDSEIFSYFNINYTVWDWVDGGMDKKKINVGLPTYGHSFQLFNVENKGLYAPAKNYGRTGTLGFASYPEVCSFIMENVAVTVFIKGADSPYVTEYDEWISFDNEESLGIKANFVKNNEFGGVMIYSLNTDDYKPTCGGMKKLPLVNKIKEVLIN